MRIVMLVAVATLVAAACGGGPAATPGRQSSAPATSRPVTTPPATAAANGPADEALCVPTAEDWQSFNYVTGASPDITSDGPGSAICQYASGVFLEVYTHDTEVVAVDTFDTIVENAPFEDTTALVSRARRASCLARTSPTTTPASSSRGRLVFTISGLARDSSQPELTTLAGPALARLTQYV